MLVNLQKKNPFFFQYLHKTDIMTCHYSDTSFSLAVLASAPPLLQPSTPPLPSTPSKCDITLTAACLRPLLLRLFKEPVISQTLKEMTISKGRGLERVRIF